MKYSEIESILLLSDPEHDWIHSTRDARTVAFYSEDVDLRIEYGFQDSDVHDAKFSDTWTQKFDDPQATSYYVHLLYRSSVIKELILVYVDGGHALLPIPVPGTLAVPRISYCIALIIDGGSSLDEAMGDAGLRVEARHLALV